MYADQLGQSLYRSLLEEPVIQVVNYQINSAVHRAKLRTWQALAVLSAFIPDAETHAAVACLWPLLQVGLFFLAVFPVLAGTRLLSNGISLLLQDCDSNEDVVNEV